MFGFVGVMAAARSAASASIFADPAWLRVVASSRRVRLGGAGFVSGRPGGRPGTGGARSRRSWWAWPALAVGLALLQGCAGPRYTTDDGRRVDEQLLLNLRAFGEGERALRPAIVRSAALQDADCDRQWELPFAVASSDGWEEDDRVAWVRALGVDERVTVVAAAPSSPIPVGARVVSVGRISDDQGEAVSLELARLRDLGEPFRVTLADRSVHQVVPFQVCRGYARLAPPNEPQSQDYHWLMTMHPLEVLRGGLDDDEALWAVLWSQGLSEEGGFRMKAFDYGRRIVGTLFNLATLATGLKSAALAAEGAVKAAQIAASKAATELLRAQLIEQGRSLAIDYVRDGLADAADKLARQQALDVMQRAATHRSSLWGVSRVAATVFDRADAWAFDRARRLQANPLAGLALHQKMVERGLASNAFALDAERLTALMARADAQGLAEAATMAVHGIRPEELEPMLQAMPLASARRAFRYDDPADFDASSPFASGLIDAMTRMPTQSGRNP